MPQVIRRARRQYRTPLTLGDTALSAGILPRRSTIVVRREAPSESRRFTRGILPGPSQGPLIRRRFIRRDDDLVEPTVRVFRRHFVIFTTAPGANLAIVRRQRIARQEAFLVTPNARRFRTRIAEADIPTAGGDFTPIRRPIVRKDQIEEARRFPRARFPKIIPLPAPPDPIIVRRRINRPDDTPLNLPHRFFRRWITRRLFATASGADSLRYYFTGAAGDGAGQEHQESCLGGFRSSKEASRIGFVISTPIPNVEIIAASRHNAVEDLGGVGLGTGSIFASGPNTLRYIAPGSVTAGPEVPFINGQTDRLDDGGDPSNWVRVKRTSASQLAGSASIEFLDLFTNVFGASTRPSSGSDNYRAVMLKNEFTAELVNLRLFIKTLIPTHVVSSVSQLGGVGSGTITATTNAFCKWPFKGWARIETSGGSLREIVYYSSRTDESLNVPALGRARLGSSAAAGAASDKIWSVPGIRIGFEFASPLVGGPVQTIPDENTSPNIAAFVSTSWFTGITAATGIQVGTLNYQNQGALWVHRELPAGVSAISKVLNLIGVSVKADGTTYDEILAGMYRIYDMSLERYEIHIGVGTEPDLTNPPTETTPTLPYDTTYQLPPSTRVYVAVNFRNRYDLVSQNMDTTIIEVNGSNSEIAPDPLAPIIVSLESAAGGTFHLRADYDYLFDPHPGDTWNIYLTTNGLEPTIADLIDSVAIVRPGVIGIVRLDYNTGAYAGGTIVKIKVAILRSSDSALSELSNTATATSETSGPSQPTGVIGQRKNYLQSQD